MNYLFNDYKGSQAIAVTVLILVVIAIVAGGWYLLRTDNPPALSPLNSSVAVVATNKVAFIGDQGYGEDAQAVLNLIKSEGADMVLHQGDFDYLDDPVLWEQQINDILGPDFPYFASVGNHDVVAWGLYKNLLQQRVDRIADATCTGDMGVNSVCVYGNTGFVLSGIGTIGDSHEAYLTSALSSLDTDWKICSWHKNQHLMQLGSKTDDVGWEAYDICRSAGAIIATGHEHSYSRTHLLSDFANQIVVDNESPYLLSPGNTIAFVSGLGGHSIRAIKEDAHLNAWWGATYTREDTANFGALFCTFTGQANCYFKDIDGVVPDQFILLK